MPGLPGRRRERALERMFETRSHAWAAVGLEVEIDAHKVRRALQRLALSVPLLIGAVVGEVVAHNSLMPAGHVSAQNQGVAVLVSIVAVVIVLALGWLISRDLSRASSVLFKRMDPSTAGTVGFLIRLGAMTVTVLGALYVGGISPQALAVGGAFTAVVLGLAAQQTLGNLFAGMVLLSARPFRVGERVRLQAGAVGGTIEGIVSSLGLLYTTLARGEDRIQVPNNVVLSAVVVPLREPESINVRVRLGAGIRPTHVQEILDANVSVPTRSEPRVLLEELDGETVVVRVLATPERHKDGARLADEIIVALTAVTGQRPAKRARTVPDA